MSTTTPATALPATPDNNVKEEEAQPQEMEKIGWLSHSLPHQVAGGTQ
jgi:hypothetical protein